VTITQSFIDGESIASAQLYDNIDPATGRSLGAVARAGADEIDRAVTAARAASRQWRDTSPAARATLLTRIADLIHENRERLARIECEDTGKPLGQARADASVAARYFGFYGHAVDSYYGQTIPLSTDLHVYTRREPFGVTGHIIAWNYPMQLLARAVAPATSTHTAPDAAWNCRSGASRNPATVARRVTRSWIPSAPPRPWWCACERHTAATPKGANHWIAKHTNGAWKSAPQF
jgi:delta 1-pyrroline-5-carboxylate dehydrogenase